MTYDMVSSPISLRALDKLSRQQRDEYIAAHIAKRDKYEAALRKIAAWKGYEAAPTWFESDSPLTDYEVGANDMLETLAGFAKEALTP